MSTTDALADPITSTVASVLTVPLRQLYALLWRAGVVEIVETHRSPRRGPYSGLVVPCPTCPNVPKHRSERLSHRPQHPPLAEPAPARADRAGCSQAVG
ncbi:MAG TPA: Rv1535 domain-containing protein [Mycobacterium sp.]